MEEVIAPDPTNLIEQLSYLEKEAELGRFDGRSKEFLVLHYLVFNSWRSSSNQENAPIGGVLRGKSSVSRIAKGTGLSKSSVKRAIEWLESEGWVYKTPLLVPGEGYKANRLRVLLSQTDLENREIQRQSEALIQDAMRELPYGQIEPRVGSD